MNEEAYWSDCDRLVKITLHETEASPELRELCAFRSWELSSWGNTLALPDSWGYPLAISMVLLINILCLLGCDRGLFLVLSNLCLKLT